MFEILNEKDEPLILSLETIKAIFKIKEYYQLIQNENVNSYLEMESYKELILRKDIKSSYLHLARSNQRKEMIKKGFDVKKLNGSKTKLDSCLRDLGITEPGDPK